MTCNLAYRAATFVRDHGFPAHVVPPGDPTERDAYTVIVTMLCRTFSGVSGRWVSEEELTVCRTLREVWNVLGY